MEEAGFEEIRVYITRKHNTFTQYIATRKILDLCERSIWRLVDWVSRRWWDQEVLDLEGVRERAAMTSDGEEEKCIGERRRRRQRAGAEDR